MKALITGITGFVGQYLAELLVGEGDEVMGSTYRDAWSPDVADAVRAPIPLFEWNLAQAMPDEGRHMVAAFAPDGIYHLAALSIPAECGSTEPSALAKAVNVGGTRSVLELAESLEIRPRLLVISSAHVYVPVSAAAPRVTEQSALGPKGAYGKTKLQAERLCVDAARRGTDVVVARAFQHSGPRQLPKFMLPEWAAQFARPGKSPIEVVTLDCHVDLSDVRDVVRAYRLLMTNGSTRGIYNVGSGRSVCGRDIFEHLVQLTGRASDAVERHPGRRQHPIADITKLTADTSWQARIPIEQTISDTLAYFRSCQ